MKNDTDKIATTSSTSYIASIKKPLCSYCAHTNAAILITGQLLEKPLCLLHYYTTRAARSVPANRVTPIGNGEELQLQLPLVQSLFSEAFVELKQQIAEEVVKQSLYHPSSSSSDQGQEALHRFASDPLSILHSSSLFSYASQRKKSAPVSTATEGGFIRQLKIPHRLRRTLRAETVKFDSSEFNKGDEKPIDDSLPCANPLYNPFKRRKFKPSTCYYEMNHASSKTSRTLLQQRLGVNEVEKTVSSKIKCSACGSFDTKLDFSVNIRNTEMARGEVWGNKDRPDLVHSYRCLHCGKAWNDEV